MEVQFPSPSVFLKSSTPAPKSPAKRPAIPKPKPSNAPKKSQAKVQPGAVTKPKQSKSRNGCATCKKKRLKCDEKKPACDQCRKRNVTCEGYNKDFKWRPFEETVFNPKPATKKKLSPPSSYATLHQGPRPLDLAGSNHHESTFHKDHELPQPPHSRSPRLYPVPSSPSFIPQDSRLANRRLPSSTSPQEPEESLFSGTTPPINLSPDDNFIPGFDPGGLSPNFSFDPSLDTYPLLPTTTRPDARSYSSGSPQLIDLLLPGTDMNQPPDPSELRPPLSPLPYQPQTFDDAMREFQMDEDFDEEITRSDLISGLPGPLDFNLVGGGADPSNSRWHFRASSPTLSDASTTSSRTSNVTILAQPKLDVSSPEMLMLRFDKDTCGILSVKDGPTENPWRTLIWPLASESPALYHAISSMTAFHGAHEVPYLHVPGMAHMTKSIKKLAFEIENMRLDSALATSLALAFSEGWDSHVSTGVQHLRGAKIMVNNAVVKHKRDMQQGRMSAQDAARLKFLCNTFVYMDVIARLTSLEESADLNFEQVLNTVNTPTGDQVEVDPLMGCATTLFPLIGRAANLIQRVRKTESNSLNIVSQAMELKEQLQRWKALNAMSFERPEDPNSEVQHAIQTAEAYRYATLLYLHQAVPEIPSDPAQKLAKKVLVTLASVPLSSRTNIIQIFPLFAASCEVVGDEDRLWVTRRWEAMMSRLKIGNVKACWIVVQEVWKRRDDHESRMAERRLKRSGPRRDPGDQFKPLELKIPPNLKRKAPTNDAPVDLGDLFFGAPGRQPDDAQVSDEEVDLATGSTSKRRLTLDSMKIGADVAPLSIYPGIGVPMSLPSPGFGRRDNIDILSDQLETEYTVRGGLHWLGVMAEWKWEGTLTLEGSCISRFQCACFVPVNEEKPRQNTDQDLTS
ncbi:hypothetical protein B0A52_06820 [Exophiala mesophila]|uniref:Zn(2)-C6 fungal-type domain-containing protein n=1 Tax=Exophiala mesophila TaxID=212818 RepID=A0A438N061_EXOME|nr:hypothetical protein B0A52_06820 [Exophiala mesophila]